MVGIAGIALLVFLGIAYSLFGEKIQETNINTISEFGYSIQNEIIMASEVHDGYERTITVPNKIGNLDFNITNDDSFLIITYSGSDFLFDLPETTGTIHKGKVTLTKVNEVVQIA